MNATLLLREPVVAEEKKTRTKTRMKIRSRFDRAGGMVDGEMVYDKETGTITVREKGARKSYTLTAAEVAEYIVRRNIGLSK